MDFCHVELRVHDVFKNPFLCESSFGNHTPNANLQRVFRPTFHLGLFPLVLKGYLAVIEDPWILGQE